MGKKQLTLIQPCCLLENVMSFSWALFLSLTELYEMSSINIFQMRKLGLREKFLAQDDTYQKQWQWI